MDWGSEIVESTGIDIAQGKIAPSTGAPADGLIAHYTFADGTATDVTGNGHDGTVNGATYLADGGPQSGGAFGFDGAGDNINIDGVAPTLAGRNELTASLWVKIPTVGDKWDTMIGINPSNGSNRFLMTLDPDGDRLRVYHGDSDTAGIGSYLIEDSWHHVVLRMDSNGLDAFLDASQDISNVGGTNSPLDSDDLVTVGAEWDDNQLSDYLEGQVGSIRLYDRALPSGEIEAIFDAEKPST